MLTTYNLYNFDNINQKKFTWCAVEHCGVLHQPINRTGYRININIDDSCNLACPSCRREPRMINSGTEYDKKVDDVSRILNWLENFNHPITISLGGSGDALASSILRKLVREYMPKPDQQFIITTNGLLIKKIISESNILPNIKLLSGNAHLVAYKAYTKALELGKNDPKKYDDQEDIIKALKEMTKAGLLKIGRAHV